MLDKKKKKDTKVTEIENFLLELCHLYPLSWHYKILWMEKS